MFSIAQLIPVSGSTVAEQALTVFIYRTMDVKGICNCVMNWPARCCGVLGPQASKCVWPHSRLVGFHLFLAVSDQLVPEFGH